LLLGVAADNHAEAETCFQQALKIARRQQAKSLELRAANRRVGRGLCRSRASPVPAFLPAPMSLGRLWQRQGKRAAAHELLAGSTVGSARALKPATCASPKHR
jgi:hypothetical protein